MKANDNKTKILSLRDHRTFLSGIEAERRMPRSIYLDLFSRDIRMEFGLDKCRIQTIHKDAGHSVGDLYIQAMTESDFYKYLCSSW